MPCATFRLSRRHTLCAFYVWCQLLLVRVHEDFRIPDCCADRDVSERRVNLTLVIVRASIAYGIVLVVFAPPSLRRWCASMVFILLIMVPLNPLIRFELNPSRLPDLALCL